MLQLDQFDYHLPLGMIAQQPAEPRDASKLLLVDRATQTLSHHHFYDLPALLQPGDVLVRNNSKVIPARLHGAKTTGGQIEILLNKPLSQTDTSETWECMTKPGLKPGQVVVFPESDLQATCQAITEYTRTITFNQSGTKFLQTLDAIGEIPLPPYINNADQAKIPEQYQTLFAKDAGSVAAPTAGLHFTPRVEKELAAKGVKIVEVTLHVGLGTFLPVKTEQITDHYMHSEWFSLSEKTAKVINQAKQTGNRIISVGTTTTRVLESAAHWDETLKQYQLLPFTGDTDIYIYPGYEYKMVSGLITNFHLPKSTLLMLVSALVSEPNSNEAFTHFKDSLVGKAYQAAIDQHYRFYSFGDAMLVL